MSTTITQQTLCDALYEAVCDDPQARYDLVWATGRRGGVRLVVAADDGGPLDFLLAIVKGGRRGYRLPDAAGLVIRETATSHTVWDGPALVWERAGLDPAAAAAAAALSR